MAAKSMIAAAYAGDQRVCRTLREDVFGLLVGVIRRAHKCSDRGVPEPHCVRGAFDIESCHVSLTAGHVVTWRLSSD